MVKLFIMVKLSIMVKLLWSNSLSWSNSYGQTLMVKLLWSNECCQYDQAVKITPLRPDFRDRAPSKAPLTNLEINETGIGRRVGTLGARLVRDEGRDASGSPPIVALTHVLGA